MRHGTRGRLEPWDVTPAQSRALITLMRSGAVRLSTLSEHLRIAPRSTTEVVDALEEKGLVARRPDPDDRRARALCPTDEGAALARRAVGAVEACDQEFFGVLGPASSANIVQHVLIEQPPAGTYTLRIFANSTVHPPQGYALAVCGQVTGGLVAKQ